MNADKESFTVQYVAITPIFFFRESRNIKLMMVCVLVTAQTHAQENQD
jgi:hypothetical protein